MDLIITEWALQSYTDLKGHGVFSDQDYWQKLRPDVELLKPGYPSANPKFQQNTFWGPVESPKGNLIRDAYKMKWHNIGPGKVQLRLVVVVMNNNAYLCQAYSKTSDHLDRREMAKVKTKTKMNTLSANQHQERGKL